MRVELEQSRRAALVDEDIDTHEMECLDTAAEQAAGLTGAAAEALAAGNLVELVSRRGGRWGGCGQRGGFERLPRIVGAGMGEVEIGHECRAREGRQVVDLLPEALPLHQPTLVQLVDHAARRPLAAASKGRRHVLACHSVGSGRQPRTRVIGTTTAAAVKLAAASGKFGRHRARYRRRPGLGSPGVGCLQLGVA